MLFCGGYSGQTQFAYFAPPQFQDKVRMVIEKVMNKALEALQPPHGSVSFKDTHAEF